MNGKVWLVGAGPSDDGLLTLKGKETLEKAEVVVYDKLVGQGVFALIPKDAEKINVGKEANKHTATQEEINQILVQKAQEGKRVVRLKGGDPFVFGRGGEELETLTQAGIPFEVVPGVTSAIAAAAYAGIPLTHRDFSSSVHIFTAHKKGDEPLDLPYEQLAAVGGTLVFLMGAAHVDEICSGLMDAKMNKDTPAAMIQNGTTARQKSVVSTLGFLAHDAKKANLSSPAVIVAGEVCRLAQKLHWADDRPLGGVRALNVRPTDRQSLLSALLKDAGAEVVEYPCIQTKEMSNHSLISALKKIESDDWIAFTSPFGAKLFFEILKREKVDLRDLKGACFAAIGSATAKEIEKTGILVDVVPSVYSAKALAQELAARGAKHVLLPRAKEGSKEFEKALDGLAKIEDIPIYETLFGCEKSAAAQEIVAEKDFDYVMLTSASTVRGFVLAANYDDYGDVHAVCIGNETEKQAKEYGFLTKTAKEATLESMVQALIEWRKTE